MWTLTVAPSDPSDFKGSCLRSGIMKPVNENAHLNEQGRLKAFARRIQHEVTRDIALENNRRSFRDPARRDPKTGLPDEALLEETLETLLQTAEAEQNQLAIMQLHVENLETVVSLTSRRDGRNAMMQALVG